MSFFKGNMALIYNPNIVYDVLISDQAVFVFSLDEDNDNPKLDPEKNMRVVMGTMLLPPVDAMWSLTSGEWDKFQMEYYNHLISPEVTEFIFMLIGLIYRGYKLVFYYPDDSSEVIKYLMEFLLRNFGIHVFEPNKENDLFAYDETKIPMYLCGIYYAGMLSAREFLYMYPIEINIPNDIYPKLIYDMKPIGNSLVEKIEYLDEIRKKMHEGNGRNVDSPFIDLE